MASQTATPWLCSRPGHTIRDGVYEPLPNGVIDTGEIYDCVIVGGGISGLAAALSFQRQARPGAKCLVLENHPIFGGEAKQNEFLVDGKRLVAHQGSAIYQLHSSESFIAQFYDSIGLKAQKLEYQQWAGPAPEMPLSQTPYEAIGLEHGQYGFWFGAKFGQKGGMWLVDPVGKNLKGAPISELTRTEWLRWLKSTPVQGDRFVHPKEEGDQTSRYLDSITLEQHYMERFGLSQETVRTFLSPVEGGGAGLGPDALSAYSDYAFEMLHPLTGERYQRPDVSGGQHDHRKIDREGLNSRGDRWSSCRARRRDGGYRQQRQLRRARHTANQRQSAAFVNCDFCATRR